MARAHARPIPRYGQISGSTTAGEVCSGDGGGDGGGPHKSSALRVGNRIKVYWEGNRKWFFGVVDKIRSAGGGGLEGESENVREGGGKEEMMIKYEDGEEHWELTQNVLPAVDSKCIAGLKVHSSTKRKQKRVAEESKEPRGGACGAKRDASEVLGSDTMPFLLSPEPCSVLRSPSPYPQQQVFFGDVVCVCVCVCVRVYVFVRVCVLCVLV